MVKAKVSVSVELAVHVFTHVMLLAGFPRPSKHHLDNVHKAYRAGRAAAGPGGRSGTRACAGTREAYLKKAVSRKVLYVRSLSLHTLDSYLRSVLCVSLWALRQRRGHGHIYIGRLGGAGGRGSRFSSRSHWSLHAALFPLKDSSER